MKSRALLCSFSFLRQWFMEGASMFWDTLTHPVGPRVFSLWGASTQIPEPPSGYPASHLPSNKTSKQTNQPSKRASNQPTQLVFILRLFLPAGKPIVWTAKKSKKDSDRGHNWFPNVNENWNGRRRSPSMACHGNVNVKAKWPPDQTVFHRGWLLRLSSRTTRTNLYNAACNKLIKRTPQNHGQSHYNQPLTNIPWGTLTDPKNKTIELLPQLCPTPIFASWQRIADARAEAGPDASRQIAKAFHLPRWMASRHGRFNRHR